MHVIYSCRRYRRVVVSHYNRFAARVCTVATRGSRMNGSFYAQIAHEFSLPTAIRVVLNRYFRRLSWRFRVR